MKTANACRLGRAAALLRLLKVIPICKREAGTSTALVKPLRLAYNDLDESSLVRAFLEESVPSLLH